MQKFLAGVDYPVRRDELVSHAKSRGADEKVLDLLKRIPDREYEGPNAVSKAFSEQR
jgi:Protein of unknown function (DUF2795)